MEIKKSLLEPSESYSLVQKPPTCCYKVLAENFDSLASHYVSQSYTALAYMNFQLPCLARLYVQMQHYVHCHSVASSNHGNIYKIIKSNNTFNTEVIQLQKPFQKL